MIAIIPARGGSKGLPGKNMRTLLGKPLIAYTIEAAQNARSVSEVIVSTDDHEIASVAESYGAKIPFYRPSELAGDDSPAIDTYLYTIRRLEREKGIPIKDLVVLLPTSPLRTSQDIDLAVSLFRDRKADSVVSYTQAHHPVHWHKLISDELRISDLFPEGALENRQNLPKTYYPNGAIYVFKKDILENGKYYSENSFAYVMPMSRSVDIDTVEDFRLAEFYLKNYPP